MIPGAATAGAPDGSDGAAVAGDDADADGAAAVAGAGAGAVYVRGRPAGTTVVTVYEDAAVAFASLPPIPASQPSFTWTAASSEPHDRCNAIPVASKQLVLFANVDSWPRGRTGKRGGRLPSRFRPVTAVHLGSFDACLARVVTFDLADVPSLREVLKSWRTSQVKAAMSAPSGVYARHFSRAETATQGIVISSHTLGAIERRSIRTWQARVSPDAQAQLGGAPWWNVSLAANLPANATAVVVFSEDPVEVTVDYVQDDDAAAGQNFEQEIAELKATVSTLRDDKDALADAASAAAAAATTAQNTLRDRVAALEAVVAAADGVCPYCRAERPPSACLLCVTCCRSSDRPLAIECTTHRPTSWLLNEAGRRAVAAVQHSALAALTPPVPGPVSPQVPATAFPTASAALAPAVHAPAPAPSTTATTTAAAVAGAGASGVSAPPISSVRPSWQQQAGQQQAGGQSLTGGHLGLGGQQQAVGQGTKPPFAPSVVSGGSGASATRHPGFTRCKVCRRLRPDSGVDEYGICGTCQSDITAI